MCQRRADFQGNVPIRAFAFTVHGRELVACIPDVFDGKLQKIVSASQPDQANGTRAGS